MASISVSKIDVDGNVRNVEGIDDLSGLSYADLPKSELDEIIDLAENIRAHGLLQPVTVKTKKDGRYRLVTGWRRLMAHQYLQKPMVPATVLKGKKDDEPLLQLIENVQRKGLNPMDVARSLDSIRMHRGIKNQESLAKIVNKSPAWVSQHLALLKADPTVQNAVDNGEIGVGGARAIASLPKGQQASALQGAKKEAKAAGSVKDGKTIVKTRGARRQARKTKRQNAGKQADIRPVAEREAEQKELLIESFFEEEFGQKKVSVPQKEVVSKFWDYLHEKSRVVIKA